VRWTVIGGLAVLAAAFSSLVSGVFAAAGAEATDSAGYRLDLLALLPTLQPFGLASSTVRLPNGQHLFGSFKSIDNALLLLGLQYGWVPLALVVLLLATGLWCLLSGRVTAPTIAVVAQIPAFVTVALITQYSTLMWFVGGLAVFSQSVAASRPPATPGDESGAIFPVRDDVAPRNSPVMGSAPAGEPFLALP
jgi:hypothetical protein